MRLIHKVPFSQQEIELYRQLVFDNITRGLRHLLDAMDEFEIKVSEENISNVEIVDSARDIGDGEPFPLHYIEPLKSLWVDSNVQRAYERGNEAALPEKCVFPFNHNVLDLRSISSPAVSHTFFPALTESSSPATSLPNKISFYVVRERSVSRKPHFILRAANY